MGIYLYCIAPAGSEPAEGLLGLDERAVTCIGVGPFALWISELERRPEPTLDRIRAHNNVVEASVSDRITPLPIRFGEWLDSREALEQRIGSRREAYDAALESVAGALEFGVRVLDPNLERPKREAGTGKSAGCADPEVVRDAAAEPHDRDPGREYMAALARRLAADKAIRQRGEEVAAVLHAELGAVVRQERIEFLRSSHGLVSVAHLVHRQEFHAYQKRVHAVRGRFPGLRFLTSGPWPPYSFVT